MTYSVIRHSAEPSDDEIVIDEGVEIIEAPYPEHGKAQVPKRCFIYDDADGYPEGYKGYIEHHGILGMKWGVRRYQNADGSLTDAGRKRYGTASSSSGDISSRKGIQRRLNDLDSAMARNKRHIKENEAIAKKYDKKEQKYKNSHASNADMKADQYEAKAEDTRAKNAKHLKAIEEGEKEVKRLLDEAVKNGYTIDRIEVMRSTAEGRDIARSLLATVGTLGIPFLLGSPIGMITTYAPSEHGTRYKVKDTKPDKGTYVVAKPGELPESTRVTGKEESDFWKAYAKEVAPKVSSDKGSSDKPAASPRHMSNIPNNPKDPGTFEQRRSAYISEHKSELLKNAKDKGTFDMEFLESNGDTDKYGKPLEGKELMAAYEKYLDDEIKRGQ